MLWDKIKIYLIMIFFLVLALLSIFALLRYRKMVPYIKKLYSYRSLLYQLVRRDFKMKYKRSVLGIFWTILNPLLTMIVMTIIFSTLFRFDIDNYPVYLLSGQLIFSFFSESTNIAMQSILGSSALIKKVRVPKYLFPVSKVLSSLINSLFSLLALIIVMIFTKAEFHLSMFAIIVPVIYITIFSLGISLLLSTMVVFFRDINYLYGIFITIISYLTPIFYPISIIPEQYKILVTLNPIYHFVECFRTVAIYGMMPTMWQNVVCFAISFSMLFIGMYFFYKKQDEFILYI